MRYNEKDLEIVYDFINLDKDQLEDNIWEIFKFFNNNKCIYILNNIFEKDIKLEEFNEFKKNINVFKNNIDNNQGDIINVFKYIKGFKNFINDIWDNLKHKQQESTHYTLKEIMKAIISNEMLNKVEKDNALKYEIKKEIKELSAEVKKINKDSYLINTINEFKKHFEDIDLNNVDMNVLLTYKSYFQTYTKQDITNINKIVSNIIELIKQ